MTDNQITKLYILLSPAISVLIILLIISVGEYRMCETGVGALVLFLVMVHGSVSTMTLSFVKPKMRTKINSILTNMVIVAVAIIALSFCSLGSAQVTLTVFVTIFLFINLFQ